MPNHRDAERWLVWALRLAGLAMLCALGAVVMPFSAMQQVHRTLGLGELPEAPLVEYLARSLSAFYAIFGALLLVLASDVERYRRLVAFAAWSNVALGLTLLAIDLEAGLPASWTWPEALMAIGYGVVLLVLLRRAGRRRSPSP